MIVSWAKDRTASFNLLIKLRNKFTQQLFNHTREYKEVQYQINKSDFYHVIFSELHGLSASVRDYESVFMIITDFEIVTQLPYLKELIKDFNYC